MTKFNRTAVKPAAGAGPITGEATPSGRTFEGAPGYARDAKSELFLLAVTNMVGEQTFYETADDRDSRFIALVRQVAVADGAWMLGFLDWLRGEANMRSASLVAAAEAVHARLAATLPADADPVTNRALINAAVQRPDEPGEFLAYWAPRYGRGIPMPVKRGVSDAVWRLYTEPALLKYDTGSHGFRFGDVIELVHPTGTLRDSRGRQPIVGTFRAPLYEHAIDRRHGRDNPIPEDLGVLRANAALRAEAANDPSVLLNAERLRAAGMTWEDVLSLAGSTVDKARLWETVIPSMGYMALLRNLRNFDQAGVSDQVAATVAARLADPAEVARSRQLPMRFLSAYRAAPSLRWAYPLEQALGHCLGNIPQLPGRTLVLVDTSTSMDAGFAKDGTLKRWDAAVVFGVALAQRCAAADVVSYSSTARYLGDHHGAHTKVFPLAGGESLLRAVERWRDGGWFLGGGTATAAALRRHFAGHDRVVLLTDEQAGSDPTTEVTRSVPDSTPLVTFNLAGYERGHTPAGGLNRITVGGLTDQAFRMIPLIEAGRNCSWPWEG